MRIKMTVLTTGHFGSSSGFKDKRGNCTGMNQIKLLTTLSFLSLNIKLENLNRTIEKHIVTALVQKLKKK